MVIQPRQKMDEREAAENLIDLESGFRTAYDQVNEIYFHKD
jgi:hypothetical protein